MAEDTHETAGPYAPDAAGADPDSRARQAKIRLAAAETAGDQMAVQAARAELDKARGGAAAARREAAEKLADGDTVTEVAKTKAPTGRAPAHKATTQG